MAHIYGDNVRETSTTTGTGTYNLDGAVAGHRTFNADMASTDTCYYIARMGSDYEIGLGTFTDATPDTLARTTIHASSNGDAAVSWAAGTKTIDLILNATGIATFLTSTLSATLNGADNEVNRVNLKDYGEITNAIGGTGGGTQDIDLTLGNSVSATVDTSANTFTFSNPTASDELCGFTLVLTNGGSQTVNWPASVDWAGGTAPTLTTAGVDILCFVTIGGGTIWHGFAASLDSQ